MMRKDGVWYTSGNIRVTDPEQITRLNTHYAELHDGEVVGDEAADEQDPPAPVGETKAAAFKRLGKARIGKALKAIELLGNLANRSTYEYTEKQVEQMKDALIKQIAASFGRFENKKADEGFEFDE